MKQRIIIAASVAALIFFISNAAAQEGARERGSADHATVPASQVVDGDYFAFGDTVEIFQATDIRGESTRAAIDDARAWLEERSGD